MNADILITAQLPAAVVIHESLITYAVSYCYSAANSNHGAITTFLVSSPFSAPFLIPSLPPLPTRIVLSPFHLLLGQAGAL